MPILYVVEELNRLGSVRSRLQTKDGFMAISDWLMKIHRPVGFPSDTKVGDGSLHFQSTGLTMPLPSEHACAGLVGEFHWHQDLVRKVVLSTHFSSVDYDLGYHRDSGALYKSPEYESAVKKLSERMSQWCDGYLDVGYVLAQWAAQNTQHPFWVNRVTARGRGLSY
ncbi:MULTISPECIES: hypothetical protein [Pseudomonas]|nr:MULTISPECIES: hypothetical protein [Pseudomonas]